MSIKQREFKIILNLIGFYISLLIGLTTPLVLAMYDFDSLGVQYKLIVPALCILLVSWFHKSASCLLQDDASFAIPGVYEMRQKYLLHVSRIEYMWLIVAILAIIFAAL